MTEQTIDAENPGQAIYDALSDEAKKAVDALPLPGWNSHLLDYLADSMNVSNAANSNGWALLANESSSGDVRYINLALNDTVLAGLDPRVVYIAFEPQSEGGVRGGSRGRSQGQ